MRSQELEDMLEELEASRASRKRSWENLQEIRWGLKDRAGVELPPPARKSISLNAGSRKTASVRRSDRQLALIELVHAIRQYRTIADSKPITLQGSEYAEAVQELNKAISLPASVSDREELAWVARRGRPGPETTVTLRQE
jgi:hypothetical protein